MGKNMGLIAKKSIVCFVATVVLAIGVIFYIRASFGLDPMSVWVGALASLLGVRFGTASLINMAALLLLGAVFARKYMGFGTVYNALLTGPMINFVETLLSGVLPAGGLYSVPSRLLFLATGITLLSLGIALQIISRFGYSAIDINIFALANKWKLSYAPVKTALDILFVVVGFLLGEKIHIGTLAGALLVGATISLFTKMLDKNISVKLGFVKQNMDVAI